MATDTHLSTSWQLATDPTFTTVLQNNPDDTTNLTSYNFTGLTPGTTYYIRSRHKGSAYGYSAWSSAVGFSTASAVIPTIIGPAQGATTVGSSVSFGISSFISSGGPDTLNSVSWQLATDSGFTTIAQQSADDTVNLTTWNVTGLSANTTYYFRARWKGNIFGYGNWSTTLSFTTKTSFVASSEIAVIYEKNLTPSSSYGTFASMSSDGSRVVIYGFPVSSTTTFSGHVGYVYVRTGNTWALESSLYTNISIGTVYGLVINGDGDTIVLSNSAGYVVFRRTGSVWVMVQVLPPKYPGFSGYNAATLSKNGDVLAITMSANDSATYNIIEVFTKNVSTGYYESTDYYSNNAYQVSLGHGGIINRKACVSGNGTFIFNIVTSNTSAELYAAFKNASSWSANARARITNTGYPGPAYSASTHITSTYDGTRVCLSYMYPIYTTGGAVCTIYTYNGTNTLALETTITTTVSPVPLYASAAISGDGTKLAILLCNNGSASYKGNVLMYSRTGTTWTLVSTLPLPDYIPKNSLVIDNSICPINLSYTGDLLRFDTGTTMGIPRSVIYN